MCFVSQCNLTDALCCITSDRSCSFSHTCVIIAQMCFQTMCACISLHFVLLLYTLNRLLHEGVNFSFLNQCAPLALTTSSIWNQFLDLLCLSKKVFSQGDAASCVITALNCKCLMLLTDLPKFRIV